MSNDKKAVYAYHLKFLSTEHMLYCKEIAQIYNIFTPNGNFNSRLVSEVIKAYQKEHDIVFEEILWEVNLKRVYPEAQWRLAMDWFMDKYNNEHFHELKAENGQMIKFFVNSQEL